MKTSTIINESMGISIKAPTYAYRVTSEYAIGPYQTANDCIVKLPVT